MDRPLPNTYWVEPGRLLAGEYPGAADDPETPDRLAALLRAGISCFIDLTEPHELAGYRVLLPPGVLHHPHPLPDHGVPRDPADMRRVLVTLQDALDAGQRVYLHCRAGIGRTGMAIGCHLREAGHGPFAAIEALNALWLQSERSRRWPSVPETAEQAAFVRRWQPVDAGTPAPVTAPAAAPARFAPTASTSPATERLRGCLLGLAVGDAMGAVGEGLPPGAWTDDTAMTLCAAGSLLARGGFDARDQVEAYRRWIQSGENAATGTAAGLRAGVREAIARAAWRRTPLAGSHDPKRLDPEPLARCAAAALYYRTDAAAAIEAGADIARVTHQAPLLVDACRLFTAMLQAALAGAGRDDILTVTARWPASPLKPELVALAAGWGQGDAPRPRLPAGGILRVLDEVGRTFGEAVELEEGLRRLAGADADADVAAAAYGALAGAHAGQTALPAAAVAQLARLPDLLALADRLEAVRPQ